MTATRVVARPSTRAASPERRALALLAVAVVLTATVGGLVRLQTDLHLGVIPFHGGLGFAAGAGTPAAAAVGAVLVVALPSLARRLRIAILAVVAWSATAVWAVAVATQEAWTDLSYPLRTRWDYWQALPAARDLGANRFLDSYVERLGSYPVHVQGHPPGMVLLLWALDAAGLRGTGWAAAVIVALAATTPAAVLLAVHWWGAAVAARQALPFLVLSPAVLFVATVGDGVFAALAAWAIALLVLAKRRRGLAAAAAAGAAGAFAGLGLHLSYGLAPLFAAAGAVVVARAHRPGLVVPVAVGAVAVTVPFIAAGFRWWDGLSATRHWYAVGAAAERPYGFFVVANIVAFALMLGPAVVAALARRPPADVAALVGAAVVAVVAADLSGLSKGEVERIWLPMLPWVSLAVVGLVRRSSPSQVRRWLGAGAAFTLVLQILVAWPW